LLDGSLSCRFCAGKNPTGHFRNGNCSAVGEKFPEVKDRLWNILDIFKEYNTAEERRMVFVRTIRRN